MTPLLAGLLVYVLAQLAVGAWVARRVATEDDYLVAGRRLGLPLVAASVFATWFGAETCVAAAGQIHAEGLGRASVEPFAYGLCLLVSGLVFAAPFWRARITTLADLLRERFSPGVERLAAVTLIPTSLLWAAAQVRAFGQVLAATSTLELEVAIGVAAGIAIVYTVMGGLLADVVTDLVQGVALVIGLVVLFAAVVSDGGGLGPTLSAIDPGRIRFTGADQPGLLATLEAWAIPIAGSVVAQEVVSRGLAARSASVARRGTLLGGGLYLAVGLIPVLLGLLGPGLVGPLDDPEQLLPTLARQRLGTVAYVVFAGALVSAILSTVDSALLVAASLLSRNLVLSGGAEASQRRRLGTARGGVVLFGLAAWYLAHTSEGIFALIEESSAFGSAGVLVAVCFALFSRVGGAASAWGTLLAGTGGWIVAAHVLEHPYAYLLSLGAALIGYLAPAAAQALSRALPSRAGSRR